MRIIIKIDVVLDLLCEFRQGKKGKKYRQDEIKLKRGLKVKVVVTFKNQHTSDIPDRVFNFIYSEKYPSKIYN